MSKRGEQAFMEMSKAFDQSFTYLIEGDEVAKIRGHLEFVPRSVRAEARAYIVELFASGVADSELKGMWRRSESELRIERGIRAFFEILRDNL